MLFRSERSYRSEDEGIKRFSIKTKFPTPFAAPCPPLQLNKKNSKTDSNQGWWQSFLFVSSFSCAASFQFIVNVFVCILLSNIEIAFSYSYSAHSHTCTEPQTNEIEPINKLRFHDCLLFIHNLLYASYLLPVTAYCVGEDANETECERKLCAI